MKLIQWTGIALILGCAVGFLTVADDLRHVGELIGVSSIGVAGIVLVVVAQITMRRRARQHG